MAPAPLPQVHSSILLSKKVFWSDRRGWVVLRFMTSGGDKLHRGSRVPQRFRFDNHYGPSENTVITTFCTVPSLATQPPPIGRPVANTACYVLDRARQPVPIGVPGAKRAAHC